MADHQAQCMDPCQAACLANINNVSEMILFVPLGVSLKTNGDVKAAPVVQVCMNFTSLICVIMTYIYTLTVLA